MLHAICLHDLNTSIFFFTNQAFEFENRGFKVNKSAHEPTLNRKVFAR